MTTITRSDLCERPARESELARLAVKRVIQGFLDSIAGELANGNRLEFRGFGVFELRSRAARTALNPSTLERVPVPARRVVRFKPSRLLKARIQPHAPDAGVAPAITGPDQARGVEHRQETAAGAGTASSSGLIRCEPVLRPRPWTDRRSRGDQGPRHPRGTAALAVPAKPFGRRSIGPRCPFSVAASCPLVRFDGKAVSALKCT